MFASKSTNCFTNTLRNITKAKITVFPLEKNEQRTSYLDCFTLEVSEQYEVDNEARIDIEMQALRKVKE